MTRSTRLWLGSLIAAWSVVGVSLLFSNTTAYDGIFGVVFLIAAALAVLLLAGRNGWRWDLCRATSAAACASRAANLLTAPNLSPQLVAGAAVWGLLAVTFILRWDALVPRVPRPPSQGGK